MNTDPQSEKGGWEVRVEDSDTQHGKGVLLTLVRNTKDGRSLSSTSFLRGGDIAQHMILGAYYESMLRDIESKLEAA